MSDRYSLEDLARIVTDPTESDEAKRLALSVAYENGKADGIRAVQEPMEKLPW
jgi:hypothetical protein